MITEEYGYEMFSNPETNIALVVKNDFQTVLLLPFFKLIDSERI